jgi:hypothetical protein
MKRKHKRQTLPSLIVKHLNGIKRALLDGEKRPAFLEFLAEQDDRRGIYALYNKRGHLYYAGKASDLPTRLNQHLGDKHAESWDRMSLFFVTPSAPVPELEGLIIAAANPPGNSRKPKLGKDMRKLLLRFLNEDAGQQNEQAIYPDRQQVSDEKLRRITWNKLRSVSQAKLGAVLGISQGRVAQLFKDGTLRKHIRDAGRRDGVLALLQKSRKK